MKALKIEMKKEDLICYNEEDGILYIKAESAGGLYAWPLYMKIVEYDPKESRFKEGKGKYKLLRVGQKGGMKLK